MERANTEIRDLKAYHKNPRKITAEGFKLLQSSLKEFGDLSGVVFNRTTEELVGGHQRVQAFKTGKGEVVITEMRDAPNETGTVAWGHILVNGERFSYREVEWPADKVERANIAANKVGGIWDYDMLANAFSEDVLLMSGFTQAELGFTNVLGGDLPSEDQNPLANSLDTYVAGNVKQISLVFKKDEFDDVMSRLDRVMVSTATGSHTDAFLALLNFYESNRA